MKRECIHVQWSQQHLRLLLAPETQYLSGRVQPRAADMSAPEEETVPTLSGRDWRPLSAVKRYWGIDNFCDFLLRFRWHCIYSGWRSSGSEDSSDQLQNTEDQFSIRHRNSSRPQGMLIAIQNGVGQSSFCVSCAVLRLVR